jgi:hypothetical protein
VSTNDVYNFGNLLWNNQEDNISELTDIRLQMLKFWIKMCTCICNDLLPWVLQSRKWRHLYKKWSVSCGLIKPNVWNKCKTEYGVDPSLTPNIYAFYRQFCETSYLCNGKVPVAAKCMDGVGIPTWCVQSYQKYRYWTPLSGKINFDSCSLTSIYSDVVSCLIA